jgi:NAD(P)-dependent dehydrogenase (short-subunit alcohol dehydrogenase family)
MRGVGETNGGRDFVNEPRWAVVTGGAQGIGRAIVEALRACDGWRVVAVDRDEEALGELSLDVVAIAADVSGDQGAQAIARELERHTSHLELLCNNAGIMRAARLAEKNWRAFDEVLAVNLRAPYVVTGTLLPWLLQGDRPSVVNIASTRALMSEPDTEPYAASKGGVVALTHAMAVSLGPQVRVNAISPGWIATEAWQKQSQRRDPGLRAEDHAQHPAGRVGTPEDVARAVLFLADPANSFVTGVNLVIDGGMTRKMIYLE